LIAQQIKVGLLFISIIYVICGTSLASNNDRQIVAIGRGSGLEQ